MGLAMATLQDHQIALTATTIIIPMLARLTATTDLTGSQAECSLALVRGMGGAAAGEAGVAAVGATVAASTGVLVLVGAVSMVDGALPAVRWAAITVVTLAAITVALGFMAEVVITEAAVSTVAAVEGSTVEAAPTAAVVVTANHQQRKINGWQQALPAVSLLSSPMAIPA